MSLSGISDCAEALFLQLHGLVEAADFRKRHGQRFDIRQTAILAGESPGESQRSAAVPKRRPYGAFTGTCSRRDSTRPVYMPRSGAVPGTPVMTSSANDIRRSFLQYFERHQHRVVSSAPLVPHDDPTLLFINAGMNQFKDVFLGHERRGYTRAATAAALFRT